MTIELSAVAPAEAGDLKIDDYWFGIGSAEPAFAEAAGQAATASGLAPHHARLFRELGQYFLLNLSGNSTTLNGEPVGKSPVRLSAGDEIGFGDALRYRIGSISPVVDPSPPAELTLRSASGMSDVDPLDIADAICWIGRDIEPFAEQAKDAEHPARFLSRGHACLYLRDNRLYLEDLASTNGTRVNGNAIDAYQPVAIGAEDRIAFGSKNLVYVADLQRAASRSLPTGTMTTGSNRTVYANAPESFLEMIFSPGEAGAAAVDGAEGEDNDKNAAGKGKRRGKTRARLGVLKEAVGPEPGVSSRRRWAVAALALVLAGATGGGIYLYGKPERDIAALLKQGDYTAGLTAADAYLQEHPRSDHVRRLATEALIKLLVPAWQQRLEGDDPAQAAALLDDYRARSAANPEAGDILDLLGWIGELRRFDGERGGIGADYRLFADHDPVQRLLQAWERDATSNEALLTRIGNLDAQFEPLRQRISSDLRVLQSRLKAYQTAESALLTELRPMLQRGDFDAAATRVQLFLKDFPQTANADVLLEDIGRYAALRRAADERDIGAVLERAGAAYRSDWMARQVDAWRAGALPDGDALARYGEALAAWADGDDGRALSLLDSLRQGVWGEAAEMQADRYRAIRDAFTALQAVRGEPDYGERLLQFYNRLDPAVDRHYAGLLAAEVDEQREKALAEADRQFEQGLAHWRQYEEAGGINGRLRLEEAVSEHFRTQALRLKNSSLALARAIELYELAGGAPVAARLQTNKNVQNEVIRQRQWLNDLDLVLQPTLLKAKLDLLPPKRENPQ